MNIILNGIFKCRKKVNLCSDLFLSKDGHTDPAARNNLSIFTHLSLADCRSLFFNITVNIYNLSTGTGVTITDKSNNYKDE